MATHSNILAWRTPWTEKPDGLQVHGVTKSWTRLSDQAQHSTASSCARWGLWQNSPSPPLLLWPSHLGLKSTVDQGV